jgi:uncharacterized phage-associated protein
MDNRGPLLSAGPDQGGQMPSCHDVAKFFLSQASEDAGDLLSNLKLQKLAYYAQGFHLAIHENPLFDEPIEAWMHGPVVPTLYHHYKVHGQGAIPLPVDYDPSVFNPDQLNLLNEVQRMYGQYSAWRLREMTHEEDPWLNNFKPDVSNLIIPHADLSRFFKGYLN